MSVEEALARLDRIQQTIIAHYTAPTQRQVHYQRIPPLRNNDNGDDDDNGNDGGGYAIEMQALQKRRENLERRGKKRRRLEEFDRAVDDAMHDVLARARELLGRRVDQLERILRRLRDAGAAGYAAVAGGDGYARAMSPGGAAQGRPVARGGREGAGARGGSRRATAGKQQRENTEDYRFAKKFFERQLSAYARIPTPWVFF